MITETQVTVSHRYYRRKPRPEIVRRIRDLREILKARETWVAPSLDAELAHSDAVLVKRSRDSLAWLAMRLHNYFPEDANSP